MKIVIGILITVLLFLVVDCVGSNEEIHTGKIVGKQYKPERVSYHHHTNGNGHTTITTSTNPEEFLLIIEGEVETTTANTSREIFYSKKEGQHVYYRAHLGLITGLNWGNTVNNKDENKKAW